MRSIINDLLYYTISKVEATERDNPSMIARMKKFVPLPHVLDLRSLALFRVLFGILQLYDIYERILINGKYDLAWYTSYPQNRSYIPEDMEFHDKFWLDLFLFRRGSLHDEIFFFIVYGACIIFLTVGYQKFWLLPVLNVLYHAMLIKVDPGQFGSDQLSCQLLLWMCFLPLSEVWSVNALVRKRQGISRDSRYSNNQVKSIACLGFSLQIVMMYMDCFCERTYEAYSWNELHESDWFGPDWPLVHYCANGSGTYNTWITKIIRECAPLNKFMTFCGFWIETLIPPLLFLLNQRWSHWLAPHIMMLHLGIGLILNIPHFYYLGALIHVIWMPTHVWDSLLGNSKSSSPSLIKDKVTHYKKTDGDKVYASDDLPDKTKHEKLSLASIEQALVRVLTIATRSISTLLQCGLLFILILSFAEAHFVETQLGKTVGNWAWSFLRFSNEFGMWSPGAARISPWTVILGWRSEGEDDIWEGANFNLYEFIRSGREVKFEDFTEDVLDNLTYLYPSTRWEKGIGDDCKHMNEELNDIRASYQLTPCL